MIIYNKLWLTNLLVSADAAKTYKSGAINAEELRKIEDKYPVGFYTPNVFIRIGLFILTSVVATFSGGLITLMLSSTIYVIDTWEYFLFLGAITYIALEVAVRNVHHFKSGIDDALIWISGGLFLTAFIIAANNMDTALFFSRTAGFIFLLALYYSLRFSDMLMTAVSLLSFISFVFFEWKSLSSQGITTMPFLMIILCAAIYLISRQQAIKKLTRYYTGCLEMVQVISLLMLYLSGNYYIVQTLGNIVNDYYSANDPSKVPLAPFFWTWTFLLPFAYLYFGIWKKDVILLRTGLLLVAAAAFTFRNYYHVMPIEGTLCIIGALLLGISYAVIKYLKTPKHGFTYEAADKDSLMDKVRIESLIISETFSGPQAHSEGTRFGGGDFGGGGAGDNF